MLSREVAAKVDQVHLQKRFLVMEHRTDAEVRNAREPADTLAILDRCPNGIDSEGWSQDITAQSNVRGRHAQLAPALCAMLYPSADLPVTSEQECRPGRIAGLQILSHERGGIDLLRGSRGRGHFHSRHIEAEAPTESDQGLHIPSALVAEAKVFTGYHML